MPAKARVAKQRRPAFSDEALALFRQLEAVPERMRQDNREYHARDLELHRMLGLGGERICSVSSVLDRDEPLWITYRPREAVAEWERVWATRQALLAAAAVHTLEKPRKENAPGRDRRESSENMSAPHP
jgi:hypothetical protein